MSSPLGDARAVRRDSCSSIERQQSVRLRLGQQVHEQPPQADRLGGQVDSRERLARRRRIAFVEDEIDHAQHAREALGQFVRPRHLVGDAGVADLRLRAHDALRQRGRGEQECLRDFLGREAAHFAQRERHLRLRRERGMAAGEDEAQPIVFDDLGVPRRGRVVGDGLDLVGDIVDRIEPGVPADAVDGLEASGGHEPRARIRRHAIARPLLERGAKGVVQRFFGEIEVAEQANERREDAPRLGAIDGRGLARARCSAGVVTRRRPPLAGAPAGFRDLFRRHFRGELVAVADHETPALGFRRPEARRGEDEPHLRLHEILRACRDRART